MDDIIRSIAKSKIEAKLQEINSMHPSLKFTIKLEQDRELPFLDMKILCKECRLVSKSYTRPTDSGLIMNFHALALLTYKRAVVSGFVHRIFKSISSLIWFHEGLSTAKQILLDNQYPYTSYELLISKTAKTVDPRKIWWYFSFEEEIPKHMFSSSIGGNPRGLRQSIMWLQSTL